MAAVTAVAIFTAVAFRRFSWSRRPLSWSFFWSGVRILWLRISVVGLGLSLLSLRVLRGRLVLWRPVQWRQYSGDADPRFNSPRAVQAALAWRGYYGGRIDGVMGPETRSAIRSFQSHEGLPVTGQIDSRLVDSLRH